MNCSVEVHSYFPQPRAFGLKFLSYQHVFRVIIFIRVARFLETDEGTIFWRATKPTQTGIEGQQLNWLFYTCSTIQLLTVSILYSLLFQLPHSLRFSTLSYLVSQIHHGHLQRRRWRPSPEALPAPRLHCSRCTNASGHVSWVNPVALSYCYSSC